MTCEFVGREGWERGTALSSGGSLSTPPAAAALSSPSPGLLDGSDHHPFCAPARECRPVPFGDLRAEARAFTVDVVLEERFRGLEVVEGPIYGGDARVLFHVFLLEEVLEVLQPQRILARDAHDRVEAEHCFNDFEVVCRGLVVETAPRHPRCRRALLEESPRRAALGKPMEFLLCWRTQNCHNFLDLVQVILPSEDRLPADELAEDTPHGPDVDRFRVLGR